MVNTIWFLFDFYNVSKGFVSVHRQTRSVAQIHASWDVNPSHPPRQVFCSLLSTSRRELVINIFENQFRIHSCGHVEHCLWSQDIHQTIDICVRTNECFIRKSVPGHGANCLHFFIQFDIAWFMRLAQIHFDIWNILEIRIFRMKTISKLNNVIIWAAI